MRDIVEQLIEDEGMKLMPYKDSLGFLTIGVGRCLDKSGISEDEAMTMLNNDIDKCTYQLGRFRFYRHLSNPRQEVLINMCFNLGIRGLMGFKKMIEALDNKDYEEASKQMLDSKWATQVGKRAERLAHHMKNGG